MKVILDHLVTNHYWILLSTFYVFIIYCLVCVE
uniref:Uncharacterized protein n=1 Tax=Tetranychus urticae TaxID=32264 RepID=T1L6G6_TETUR